MRGLALAALLAMLTLAPGQKGVVEAERRPVPPPAAAHAPSSTSDRSVPGGGKILFLTGDGIGVVDAAGLETRFGHWSIADAFWDPVHPGNILVHGFDDKNPRLREYSLTIDGWRAIASWPTGYPEYSQISPDGRWCAYNVFVKGKMTWTIRMVGRDGTTRTLYRRHAYPASWTPDDRVILSDWRDDSTLLLWDPFRDRLRPFTIARHLTSKVPVDAREARLDVGRLSWSSDGRFFAAPLSWVERTYHTGVAVGSLARGVLAVLPTGGAWSAPTWSPTRPEIAFVSSSGRGDPRDGLQLYDAPTGRLTLVREGVQTPWWVAWSPTGDWMLLDGERGHWVFISRDGRQAVQYPSLGGFPRWASPGFSLHIFVC